MRHGEGPSPKPGRMFHVCSTLYLKGGEKDENLLKIGRESQEHKDSAIIRAGNLVNHIRIDPCMSLFQQGCVLQCPRDLIRVPYCCACWETVGKDQQPGETKGHYDQPALKLVQCP